MGGVVTGAVGLAEGLVETAFTGETSEARRAREQGEEQRKKAEELMAQQQAEIDKAKKKKETDEARAKAADETASKVASQRRESSTGRKSTILTDKLGASEDKKNLLGI